MRFILLAPADVSRGTATGERICMSEAGLDIKCLDMTRRHIVLVATGAEASDAVCRGTSREGPCGIVGQSAYLVVTNSCVAPVPAGTSL